MNFALTTEQRRLRGEARRLAETVIAPRAAEVDRSEAYPWDNVAALRDAGLMGYTIPQAYGGSRRQLPRRRASSSRRWRASAA